MSPSCDREILINIEKRGPYNMLAKQANSPGKKWPRIGISRGISCI